MTRYFIADRDCNPGLEFSIPGFGIAEFPIPGSRRDWRTIVKTTKAPSKVTSLIDRLKYTCDVTRDTSFNRQLYQCNDCNGRFTTLQSLHDNMWSRRLCRVVKRKSCETCWILLGQLMTTHMSFDGLRSQSRRH